MGMRADRVPMLRQCGYLGRQIRAHVAQRGVVLREGASLGQRLTGRCQMQRAWQTPRSVSQLPINFLHCA